LQYVWDVEAGTLGGLPLPRDGTGSETSVAGVLWDCMDTAGTNGTGIQDDDPAPGPPARAGAALRALRSLPVTARITFEDYWRAWQDQATPAERDALAAILADFHIEYSADAAEPDLGENSPPLVAAPDAEAPGGVVISEVQAGAQIAVELVNRSAEAQALGGWRLQVRNNTSTGNPALTYTIPTGFVLQAGGRVVVRRGRSTDDTPRELYADLWTVPWFLGFEGALALLDAQGRGVDFVRWSARDGTASTTPAPAGTAWQGEVRGADFGQSLARHGDRADTDRGDDFAAGSPTLGAPNATPALHRTFFPAGDRDALQWRVERPGVFTIAVRRLRSGALPELSLWTRDGRLPAVRGEPVRADGAEMRVTLALGPGDSLTARLEQHPGGTALGAYDVLAWSESDVHLPLPPRGVRTRVTLDASGGDVDLRWWNAAVYDSVQVRAGNTGVVLPGAARAWSVRLPSGPQRIDLVAFARGVAAAAPGLLVDVDAWPATLRDDFETLDTSRWETSGDWGLDTAPGRSGRVLSTHPGGPYGDDRAGAVRLRDAVLVTASTHLEFDHICAVRPEDRARIEVSDDWGASWQLLAAFDWNAHRGDGESANWRDGTADAADWVHESLDCGSFAGRPVQVRFAFASDGRGTADGWRIDALQVTSAPPPPARLALYPNVPNPFNPTTRIRFALPQAGKVELDIFDVRGRRVCRLVDAWLEAGEHETSWDGRDGQGRNVASGVYFDALRTAAGVESRKLVLLR
jgi:hypothetical protein